MPLIKLKSEIPFRLVWDVARSPKVIGYFLRHFIAKKIIAPRKYQKNDGLAGLPVHVSIKITNLCNLRCKMCGQWGEKGTQLDVPMSEIKDSLPIEKYYKLVDELKSAHPLYVIWGGEPALYKDLLPLIKYMKKNGAYVSMITNGLKLKERAQEIVDYGVDIIFLSIDGPEERHNEIRGSDTSFQVVKEGIAEISRIKKEKRAARPLMIALTTVTEENCVELEELFETIAELNFNGLSVFYSWFTTETLGKQYQAIMKRDLGVKKARSWKGFVGVNAGMDIELLKKNIKKVKSRKWSFPYLFMPPIREDQLQDYYQKSEETFGAFYCIAPWTEIAIMPNGDVVPCADYPDYTVGNITESNLFDIWNGEKMQKFRKLLKKRGGLLPICYRCCRLMGAEVF